MSFRPGFPNTRSSEFPWQQLQEMFSLVYSYMPTLILIIGRHYAPKAWNLIQILIIDRRFRDPDFSPRQAVDNLLYNLQGRIQGDRLTPVSEEQMCDDMGCFGSGQTMAILKISELMAYVKTVRKDGSLYCFLTEKGFEHARIVEARWNTPAAPPAIFLNRPAT